MYTSSLYSYGRYPTLMTSLDQSETSRT